MNKEQNNTTTSVKNVEQAQVEKVEQANTQPQPQAQATATTQDKIYFTLKTIGGAVYCLIGAKSYKVQRVEKSPYIKVKTDFNECYHLTFTPEQMKTVNSGKVCEHIVNDTSNKTTTTRITRHNHSKGLESYLFNALEQLTTASNFYKVNDDELKELTEHFNGTKKLTSNSKLKNTPSYKLLQARAIISELYKHEKDRKEKEQQAKQEQLIQQEYNSIIEQFKRFNISYNEQDILNTIKAKYTTVKSN